MQKTETNSTFGTIWEILFKINLVLVPLIMTWGIWVTSSIFEIKGWMHVGPRFTSSDAIALHEETVSEVKDWVILNYVEQNEITRIESAINFNTKTLLEIKKENIELSKEMNRELSAIRLQLVRIEKSFE